MTNQKSFPLKTLEVQIFPNQIGIYNNTTISGAFPNNEDLICTIDIPPITEDLTARATDGGIYNQVVSIADSLYGLDELAYFLDTPESDVTIEHLRKQAYEVLAKTVRFIQSLPTE